MRSTVYCPRCLCILHPRIFHYLISKSCVTSLSVCVRVSDRERERERRSVCGRERVLNAMHEHIHIAYVRTHQNSSLLVCVCECVHANTEQYKKREFFGRYSQTILANAQVSRVEKKASTSTINTPMTSSSEVVGTGHSLPNTSNTQTVIFLLFFPPFCGVIPSKQKNLKSPYEPRR